MSPSTDSEALDALAGNARRAALAMAGLDAAARDAALLAVRAQLQKSRATIEAANELDLEAARTSKLDAPLLKRLDVRGQKFDVMLAKLDEVRAVADPIGAVQLATRLDEGLDLYRIACPIGVVAVIFESRPDAAVQIACLAIKSANGLILKGGKEAASTNAAIVAAIQAGLSSLTSEAGSVDEAVAAAVPPHAVQLVQSRDEVSALLKMHGKIDLIVPRGSNALVSHIIQNTRIPVLGHADGICAIFLDQSADPSLASRVIVDAKTDYPVACNAAETLLVHAEALHTLWPAVAAALLSAGVSLRCDEASRAALPAALLGLPMGGQVLPSTEKDYRTEFGELTLAVKAVASVTEAVGHINAHSSHHTDAILSRDPAAIRFFTQFVDSAGVYVNASTRFADGQRYGFGAEVGVSTNRIHSRGPMGVEGLLIYKYILLGNGQIAADYSSGRATFKHTPIPRALPPPVGNAASAAAWPAPRVLAVAAAAAACGAVCGAVAARSFARQSR